MNTIEFSYRQIVCDPALLKHRYSVAKADGLSYPVARPRSSWIVAVGVCARKSSLTSLLQQNRPSSWRGCIKGKNETSIISAMMYQGKRWDVSRLGMGVSGESNFQKNGRSEDIDKCKWHFHHGSGEVLPAQYCGAWCWHLNFFIIFSLIVLVEESWIDSSLQRRNSRKNTVAVGEEFSIAGE